MSKISQAGSKRCGRYATTGRRRGGFSLVELLAVMAVVAMLLALLVPSIESFSSTVRRKGAVDTLMNVFTWARAAALESGTNVHVVLWKRTSPEADAVMVVRDRPAEDLAGGNHAPISRWLSLPSGVIFRTIPNSIIAPGAALPDGFDPSVLPQAPPAGSVAVVSFNSTGAIGFPGATKLHLYVSKGVRDASGLEAVMGATAKSVGLEELSLARFTGRVARQLSDGP